MVRIEKRVGPVARNFDDYDIGDRRVVVLDGGWPSGGLGVAVEAPEKGTRKK